MQLSETEIRLNIFQGKMIGNTTRFAKDNITGG